MEKNNDYAESCSRKKSRRIFLKSYEEMTVLKLQRKPASQANTLAEMFG